VKYTYRLFNWTTNARVGHGANWSYSGASAFAMREDEFPYSFFIGMLATIGLCLGIWATHAKHQQELAIEDCVETELASAGADLERATSICEMKCVRGQLSACM